MIKDELFEQVGVTFNKHFKDDLRENKKYENYVKDFLVDIGYKFIEFCDNKDYDLLMKDKKGKEIRYEIKSDKQTKRGNLIIEYRSWDKPSGIAATKADYWVFIFPLLQEIWFIRISEMKRVIAENDPLKNPLSSTNWTSVNAGDGQMTKCYLWNRQIFRLLIGSNGVKIIKRNDIPL